MVLRQPWALLGLLALALPVLVHLLSRAPARRRAFPSLRFIDESRLPPRRLTSVHEPWLLALRVAIVALAALALAQPVFGARMVPQLARAIVVDTSASMLTPIASSTGAATRAADSARQIAASLADSATIARVFYSASPATAIATATGWLGAGRASRELVVLSDFRGFDSTSLSRVPAGYGVRLVPVTGAIADTFRVASAPPFASMTVRLLDDRTLLRTEPIAADVRADVRLDLSTLPSATAARVRRAVTELRGSAHATAMLDSSLATHRVRVVEDGADRAPAVDVPPLPRWMTDVLVAMVADPLARETAASMGGVSRAPRANEVPVLYGATGAPVLLARWNAGDSATLELAVATADAEGVETLAAALAVAMTRGVDALAEHEIRRPTDETLRRLSRAPTDTVSGIAGVGPVGSATDEGPSDARWVWAAVLLLLGAETVLRRRLARQEQAA